MEWALRRHVLHRSRTNQMASPLVYHSLPQLYANHKPMLTLHQETAFRNEPSLFGVLMGQKVHNHLACVLKQNCSTTVTNLLETNDIPNE